MGYTAIRYVRPYAIARQRSSIYICIIYGATGGAGWLASVRLSPRCHQGCSFAAPSPRRASMVWGGKKKSRDILRFFFLCVHKNALDSSCFILFFLRSAVPVLCLMSRLCAGLAMDTDERRLLRKCNKQKKIYSNKIPKERRHTKKKSKNVYLMHVKTLFEFQNWPEWKEKVFRKTHVFIRFFFAQNERTRGVCVYGYLGKPCKNASFQGAEQQGEWAQSRWC